MILHPSDTAVGLPDVLFQHALGRVYFRQYWYQVNNRLLAKDVVICVGRHDFVGVDGSFGGEVSGPTPCLPPVHSYSRSTLSRPVCTQPFLCRIDSRPSLCNPLDGGMRSDRLGGAQESGELDWLSIIEIPLIPLYKPIYLANAFQPSLVTVRGSRNAPKVGPSSVGDNFGRLDLKLCRRAGQVAEGQCGIFHPDPGRSTYRLDVGVASLPSKHWSRG